MITPFVLLLLAIAVMPFINRHWWEHNYPLVSLAFGSITVIYYFFILKNGPRMIFTAIEYFSFIVLLGSLFVVAGGIHIRIKGRSTPLGNIAILGAGSVIANVLGTTGASMVLIRPFIRINRYRISGYHVIFFIFLVSNIGGMLTPIGDPPIFMGYLKGIPFFWVMKRVWHIWAISVIAVLLIFYIIDRRNYRKFQEGSGVQVKIDGEMDKTVVEGLHNIFFLGMILFGVFLHEPIREIVMITAAVASYLTTRREIHERNEFNFVPIKEVAILFAGIFATMVPALDWLELNAEKLGITKPGQFYWGTGILSAFLDNTPTYLNFLSAAFGLHGLSVDNIVHMRAMLGFLSPNELSHLEIMHGSNVYPVTETSWVYIQAISVSAVLFGAMTYIGNGPNFMVKSIAEQFNINMPSFFGYMVKYSIPILIPVFAGIWYFFFR
jgi:Na+/H+ antiporter NhaD/arsenite permease-like protein